MARNYFADPFSTGQDAFDGAYDRTQAMTNQVRRVRAGRALAAGDRQAAMSEFGNAGMTDEVRQIQQDQVDDDDRAAKQAAEAQEQDTAQAKERADLLIKVAGALKSVPAGQRKSALGQVYPIFQQAGIDTGVFDGLTEDQLSDQSLDLFTGEVEKQKLQIVNRGGGGYDVVDMASGGVVRSVEPDPRLQIVGDGATALDPRTRQPVYTNPKNFAPPRTSGGVAGPRVIGSTLPEGY